MCVHVVAACDRYVVVVVGRIEAERLPLLTLTWCVVSLASSPPQAPMFPGHHDLEAQFHAHSEWLWSQWEMHVPAANVIMVPSSTPAAHVRVPPCVRQRCSACASCCRLHRSQRMLVRTFPISRHSLNTPPPDVSFRCTASGGDGSSRVPRARGGPRSGCCQREVV